MNFNFIDPFPKIGLNQIFPFSARARSWLARASREKGFLQDRAVQIGGSVYMLGGLDYHHRHFILHVDQLKPYYQRQTTLQKHLIELRGDYTGPSPTPTDSEREILDCLSHDAFAYLSRLGQFYAFAKALDLDALLPRVSELMPFRNKHTAHRSIDDPRKEDTPQLQEFHAMAFGFCHISVNFFPVFQIYDHRGFTIQLHMRDDHPIIMQQALDALQKIQTVPP